MAFKCAASVTPTRAISCARAEHRVSIEHHSVRRPSMRASEQRRVSMLKLTQPQRRASQPHEGDQLRKSRASSAILRRPSMRARASASVTPTEGRSAGCLSLQGRSAAHELGIERQPAILSSSRLALQNGSLAATVKPRWEKVQFGSCIACRPVLYRYHTVPELEISTFFP